MSTSRFNIMTRRQLDLIYKSLEIRREFLSNKIKEFEDELHEINLLLAQDAFDDGFLEEHGVYEQTYNPNWSFSKRAEFVLKSHNRPMSTAEIADYIIKVHEPEADRKQLVRNLSVAFTTKPATFKKIERDGEDNAYELANKKPLF